MKKETKQVTVASLTEEVVVLTTIVELQKMIIKRLKSKALNDPKNYALLEGKANILMEKINFSELREWANTLYD